jgi:cytochrome c oxidase subunit I+III
MTTTAIGERVTPPQRTLPMDGHGHHSTGWWGMVFLIITEAALFAFLLFSYFYLDAQSTVWPPAGPPELTLAVINTIILVASSVPMRLGVVAIRQGRRSALTAWLILAILTGIAFLIIEAIEWSRKPFTPQTNAYGSLFFTITGFHYAHVVIGVLMLVVITLRNRAGHFTATRNLAVEATGLYWHFVGLVWLFVVTSLYVTPHWFN